MLKITAIGNLTNDVELKVSETMTRTVMRSIGKRRNNEKRRGDADEDTDRRNHI